METCCTYLFLLYTPSFTGDVPLKYIKNQFNILTSTKTQYDGLTKAIKDSSYTARICSWYFVFEWRWSYLCGPALATGVLTGGVRPHLIILTSPLTLQEHTENSYIVKIYHIYRPLHYSYKHCNCTCFIILYQFLF